MAKKIVQLENKDGDQIFPISATDIALPGTKVKTEFVTSGGNISAQTDTVLVTETIATPGDYAVIGSTDMQMTTSGRIDVRLYHNGSTQLAQQYTTPIGNRAGLTIIGRLDNASEGDTVSLSVKCDYSATTDNRTQGLVLIKLPEGAPTYKGGALNVTLNQGGTWSGATTLEMSTAVRTGKQVVFDGPFFDGGHAILLGFIDSILKSWGVMVNPVSGVMYEIIFDDSNSTWSVREMTDPGYSTSEVKTGQHWIDGKPIYKKTIVRDAGVVVGTPFTVSHGISNLSSVVRCETVATGGGEGVFPAPLNTSGGNYWSVWSVTTTEVKIYSSISYDKPLYITLYYTKTTD